MLQTAAQYCDFVVKFFIIRINYNDHWYNFDVSQLFKLRKVSKNSSNLVASFLHTLSKIIHKIKPITKV